LTNDLIFNIINCSGKFLAIRRNYDSSNKEIIVTLVIKGFVLFFIYFFKHLEIFAISTLRYINFAVFFFLLSLRVLLLYRNLYDTLHIQLSIILHQLCILAVKRFFYIYVRNN